MTDYAEIVLADDTSVRLELAPVGAAPSGGPGGEAGGPRPGRPRGVGGVGGVTPVSRPSRTAALATDALRTVLRPLGPLLQEVHDAVSAVPNPPHEINVQFGVQVGQDLKLGIVGANGQASLTVSATWQLPAEAEAGRPGAGQGDHQGQVAAVRPEDDPGCGPAA
ncbi:CU044_2847 family protein [Streptomyces sp. ME19-01-6]|uniref:CU044_2847 family protein n=1 Tax=Streptomyces sp. ME19-01-6 TaxID=3028686 RepID=UPI0029A54150|nr:CU044_2847 family protein [Streptomyces sp. ME19-01-6]MDX3228862.1 CU044_2847 family protein [Streptomyces sp. ME19-01-6]